MAERVARRVVVHGRVQGVYFRDSAQRMAQDAGVTGWVRNADDGTVQAHLEGEPDAVEQVVAYLREGPSHARVRRVDVRDAAVEEARDFEMR